MRLLSITLLAGVLLVGLVAAPAAADRDFQGQFPHFTFAHHYGVEIFDQSEVVQVPTGEWVVYGGGWGTVTEEQREQFLATVIVEVERNGVPQPVATSLFENPGGAFPYIVAFENLMNPGRANVPEVWTTTWTFTEDHFDGVIVFPAGTVFEGTRTIVWTPRGQFPSAAYPCPNGAYPCVDI